VPQGKELTLTEEADVDEKAWRGEFTFVVGTDVQLGFLAAPIWGDGRTDQGDDWEEEIELAHSFVRAVNKLAPRPRFVLVAGDMVHEMPSGLTPFRDGGNLAADRFTAPELWKRQNEDFFEIMSGLCVPLLCIPGNHDVGDRPTPATIDAYRGLYGSDHYGFWCQGLRGICLNSMLMKDGGDAEEAHDQQEEWLKVRVSFPKPHGSQWLTYLSSV